MSRKESVVPLVVQGDSITFYQGLQKEETGLAH